jgi:hypothetical protein
VSTTEQTRHATTNQPSHHEQSLVAQIPNLLWDTAWKHRWPLAPFYLAVGAGCSVVAGYGLTVAGGLGMGTAAAELAAWQEWTFRGRTLMSTRERHLAAIALAATALWSAIASVATFLPGLVTASLLPAALAVPAYRWIAGRKSTTPEPTPSMYSPMAQAVLDGWAGHITVGAGPRLLRGSVPILDSLREPAEGALTMDVQLPYGVNSRSVVGSANRDSVEALLSPAIEAVLPGGMPSDTVRLERIREHSTRVRVILTPSRHLEVEGGMPYQGAVLLEDGGIPLADCADGEVAHIPLFDSSGVKHGFISGTSGAGKSSTTAACVMPGVKAGLELIFYIDGKEGTSSGVELDPAITRMAVNPKQWIAMIEMVDRILAGRKTRRGRQRRNKWKALEETDPIITLLIDEATSVNKKIGSKHVDMVSKMLREGRVFGIRVIQVSQSPSAEDLIGNIAARNLMTSAGWAVCHRAGGSGASRLTLDSAPGINVDLRGLPDGQAALLVQGRLLAFPSAVRYADDEAIAAELEGHVTLELAGGDLTDAGPIYAPHHWGYAEEEPQDDYVDVDVDYGTPPAPAKPSAAQDDLPTSRFWVLDRLAENPAGMTLNQLEAAAETADPKGPSRRTISSALNDLMSRKNVAKNGAAWTAVEPELTDDLSDEESQ